MNHLVGLKLQVVKYYTMAGDLTLDDGAKICSALLNLKKAYDKERTKKHYEKNKDKIRKNQKEYREKNKDKRKEHYEKNKDKIRKNQKEYREKNKDKREEHYEKNKDKIRKYYEKNKDKIRKHYEKNKDKINERRRNLYRLINPKL